MKVIVSDKFSGVSLLDRQRRMYNPFYGIQLSSVYVFKPSLLMKNANEEVNEAIKPFMDRIHAVTMKCLTPAQFETRKDSIMAARQN